VNRRSFLVGVSAAVTLQATRSFAIQTQSAVKGWQNVFTLGVASGDPTSDGFVIWTRLAPDHTRGDGGLNPEPIKVLWEISADPSMRKIIRRGQSVATPELGHSVHVEVTGLQPDREYFYRFHSGGFTSAVGRSRTAPALGTMKEKLRFAFASCQNYENGYYVAHRDLAIADVDAVLFLGDYIYEGNGNRGPRVHSEEKVLTLDDYRKRYALYKSDIDLQAAHAAHPWIVTFDDHEVANNWAGDIDQENSPVEIFRRRRAAAFQAYYENMPLRRSSLPNGSEMCVYRKISYGRLAQFTVVDTRQYRTDQPCGDNWKRSCPARLDESATMMGPAQEKWFADTLSQSSSLWNVVANQVMIAQLKEPTEDGATYNMDQWDGYPAARKRLTEFLAIRKPSNPVFITGDTHQTWVGDLKQNFEDPKSATVASELVGTSISSAGDGSVRSANAIKGLPANPHLIYENGKRGYFLCELTEKSMVSELRTADKVSTLDGKVGRTARFVIEANKPGVYITS
jgi:alkaline phosphatase D